MDTLLNQKQGDSMIRLKEKHRTFTNAFRIMAIKLEALPGVMAKDIAEILEIHPLNEH